RPNIPEGCPRGSRTVIFRALELAESTERLQPTHEDAMIAPMTNKPQNHLALTRDELIFSSKCR
ncbi:MAG TPA: hypothetical protein VMG30_16310, partial [Acidobacteriota bacterium]|nr:hypothetical protein [Acidobacteriota bacterium]